MNKSHQYADGLRWIPVINRETVAIPPYAMMEVGGDGAEGRVPVRKPTTDSATTGIMVNGPSEIPATRSGQTGVGQGLFANTLVKAGYSTQAEGDDANTGETWGVAAGSWWLSEDQTGFRIVNDGAEGLCNIIPESCCDTTADPTPCCCCGSTTPTTPGMTPTVPGVPTPVPAPPIKPVPLPSPSPPVSGLCQPGTSPHYNNQGFFIGCWADGVVRNGPSGGIARVDPGLRGFLGDAGVALRGGRFIPVPEGGTGIQTAGTSGNVLTSNGTGFVSSPPAAAAGTVSQVANAYTTGLTAAANIITYATPAADGIYLASGYIKVTGGTPSLILTLSWTDKQGNAQGVQLTPSAPVTSVGTYVFSSPFIWTGASSNILLDVGGVFIGSTYNVGGAVLKLAS